MGDTVKLYIGSTSIFSNMVRLVMVGKGIPHELVTMNLMNGDGVAPDYLRKNPAGKVPLLEVDHQGQREYVPESLEIAHRLEKGDLGGKSLAPKGESDPAWRWAEKASQLDFQRITFRSAGSLRDHPPPPLYENAKSRLEKVAAENPDLAEAANAKIAEMEAKWTQPLRQQDMDACWAAFSRFLDELDAQLQRGGPLIEGRDFSVADAFVIPVLVRLTQKKREDLIEQRPAVRKYWQHVQHLAEYTQVYDQQQLRAFG